jgi:hypothetical protein
MERGVKPIASARPVRLDESKGNRGQVSPGLGDVCIHSNPVPSPPLIRHEELTIKSPTMLPD